MGASGDMLAGALIGLVDKNKFLSRLNDIGLNGVSFELKEVEHHGIKGIKFLVVIDAKPSHNTLPSITQKISNLKISDKVKSNAIAVYNLIAQVESAVHGEPVNQIHFHEVGDLDAIADIVAVSMLIEEIAPDEIICSPVNTGSGAVKCAHGILPVPAPATKILLEGISTFANEIKSELCTPTGAALLKHFATNFQPLPQTAISSNSSAGFGVKIFDKPNCVKAYL